MRKILICAAVAASFVAGPVLAGNTQVGSSLKSAGKTGYIYGRSDGVFQDSTTHSPYIVENGQSAGPVGKGFYMDFTVYAADEGVSCRDQSALGTCVGNTTLVPCLCTVADGTSFIWLPLVTEDIVPDMDAGSLDIGADQTDNDGAMLVWGLGGASGRPFVIGRDPAFYMCTRASFADATGIDQNIMAGFFAVDTGIENTSGSGGADAFNADFEALDAYAGIGVLGTAAAGVTLEDITIKTETDAARDGTGDGVTSTDTTDNATEGTYYTYCTYVSATGVVTYTVDNAAPTTTAAFTFVDGISVAPFITYLHTNDVAGEIDLTSIKVGYSK